MFPWRRRKVVWLTGTGFAIVCGCIAAWLLALDVRRPAKPPTVHALLGAKVTEPKVAAGQLHLVVLTEDGSLWGTGANQMGQMGSDGGDLPPEKARQFFAGPLRSFGARGSWIDVAVTQTATIGLRRDGTVWSWGAFDWPRDMAQAVQFSEMGAGMKWKRIAGGTSHVVLIRDNGELWVKGRGTFGKLGDATSRSKVERVRVGNGSTWREISAGGSLSAAIDQDGGLWAWGAFSRAGTNSVSLTPFPLTRIGEQSSWTKSELQNNAVVAQDLNGDLWRLALQEDLTFVAPERLPVLPDGIRSFAASSRSVVAVDRLGKTWIYGDNHQRVLGANPEKGFSEWTLLDAGGNHRFVATSYGAGAAIGEDGVVTWGQRYDAYEERSKVPFLELRRWLSKQSSIFPVPSSRYTLAPYYEPKPWSLMQFARTNRIDTGVEP